MNAFQNDIDVLSTHLNEYMHRFEKCIVFETSEFWFSFHRQLSALWLPIVGLTTTDDIHSIDYATDLNDDQKQAFDVKTIDDRFNSNSLFLHKDKKLIYPELKVAQKLSSDTKSKGTNDRAASKKVFSDLDLQTWLYNKVLYMHHAQLMYPK
jgi:hypothetical protein